MPVVSLRAALALSALLAGGALFAAMASEWWGGLVPCLLCLVGRWPYRAAILCGVLGVVAPARLRWWAGLGVALSMLAGVAVGVVHVGVEARWWPSPLPGCSVRLVPGAALPERPAKPCDEPAYLIEGLPVSMAAMSLVFSLGLGGAMAWVLARRGERA
jgi:disulfide bond formation protein DsbB